MTQLLLVHGAFGARQAFDAASLDTGQLPFLSQPSAFVARPRELLAP